MYLAYKKEYLNKVLFIVLLTIFIIMCLISPCFAVDLPIIVKDNKDIGHDVSITSLPSDAYDFEYVYFGYVINYWHPSGYYLHGSLLCTDKPLKANSNKSYLIVDSDTNYKYFKKLNFFKNTSDNDLSKIPSELDLSSFSLENSGTLSSNTFIASFNGFNYLSLLDDELSYASTDVLLIDSDEVVFEGPEFEDSKKDPYIINTQEELESGKFDTLNINSADLIEEEFYLFSYYYSDNGEIENIYPRKEILLDGTQNNYYVGTDIENGGYIYEIPFSQLGIDLVEGKKYGFKLATKDENGNVTKYYSEINFTIGTVSPEDVTNSKLEEQTDAIKENTETNKGIWESIKEILSYLNPFSENFFVYKLIELLVEAIKSLFIPSDDFFSTYFTDLKEWFSDRLGFLFYPFELLIDILNEILNIDFSNPIFNIPDIVEPFSNKKLINATTFNLNDLLNNSVWNTIHSIYLVCVDAFVVFGLVALFRKKYEEVTTK